MSDMSGTLRERWAGACAIGLLAAILFSFPNRYTFGPPWIVPTVAIALGVLSAVSIVAPADGRWRLVILTVVGLTSVLNGLALAALVYLLLFVKTEITGLRLLSTAVSIWLTNVVTFALFYWAIDGGGPLRRARDAEAVRDFVFPGDSKQPGILDYLFLAFNTATAFSPTDTVPLTTRSRMAMMVESLVSLMAIAIAAARAINILR